MAMPGSSNSTVTVTLVILAWYSSNIGVLLLNKFLLTHTSFKKPVFLTLCHMCACVLVGGIISLSRILPVKPIKSRPQGIKIGILSCIFCFTIVAANASLRFLPVSFNQAVGSTTPLFTAIFAFFLQGVKEESMTYATLIPIAVGIMIASGGEPLFHFIGFMLCMSATAGRAMKSVIQSMLLSDPNDKMDSMCLLFYMASCSVVILVPAVFILEPEAFGLACDMVNAPDGDMFFWAMVINSLLAYLTNLTNFLVTKFTSALTLQVRSAPPCLQCL
jgi:drug/metabolite transporter (DMT)-like permease